MNLEQLWPHSCLYISSGLSRWAFRMGVRDFLQLPSDSHHSQWPSVHSAPFSSPCLIAGAVRCGHEAAAYGQRASRVGLEAGLSFARAVCLAAGHVAETAPNKALPSCDGPVPSSLPTEPLIIDFAPQVPQRDELRE